MADTTNIEWCDSTRRPGPAPRPRCACGKPSAFQCDAPTRRSNGTCSRHLCAKCATVTGPDTHLCPTHAAHGVAVQASMEF